MGKKKNSHPVKLWDCCEDGKMQARIFWLVCIVLRLVKYSLLPGLYSIWPEVCGHQIITPIYDLVGYPT